MDKKDQWFSVYTLRPVYGPISGEPQHVWHPNACHPNMAVRHAHRAKEQNETPGRVIVACGKVFDNRTFVVESRSDVGRCEACAAAHEAAAASHADAEKENEALRVEQSTRAELRERAYHDAIQRAAERVRAKLP